MEIIAVFDDIPARHVSTLCKQDVEFLVLDLVAHTVASGLLKAIVLCITSDQCDVEQDVVLLWTRTV
jgi:hypothetical protein